VLPLFDRHDPSERSSAFRRVHREGPLRTALVGECNVSTHVSMVRCPSTIAAVSSPSIFLEHASGPVALFEVDDVSGARSDLVQAGIEVIGAAGNESGVAYALTWKSTRRYARMASLAPRKRPRRELHDLVAGVGEEDDPIA